MLRPGYKIGPITIGHMAGTQASPIAAFDFG